jgi:nucleotide-binding universal stress UspA family protein
MAQLRRSTPSSHGPFRVAEVVASGRRPDAATADLAGGGARVLVLYERGRSGSRAIDHARELTLARDGQLTVVTVAPMDMRVRGCGVSARDYNDVVCDSARRELDEARRLLGSPAERIVFEVVFEDGHTSLAGWAANGAFDVILLPARRRLFSRLGHPLTARLRESTGADVRIVGA